MEDSSNRFFARRREALFPLQFVILGILLMILGPYLLFIHNYWGILAFVTGVLLSFTHVGIQLDFIQNIYREYYGFFQFKAGKWQKLEKVQYITVFIDNWVQEMHVASISANQKREDVMVNLVISKTHRIGIGTFKNRPQAMEMAGLLAEKLNCRFLDYTSGEPIWIK